METCDQCKGYGKYLERPKPKPNSGYRKINDGLPLVQTGDIHLDDFKSATCGKCIETGRLEVENRGRQ